MTADPRPGTFAGRDGTFTLMPSADDLTLEQATAVAFALNDGPGVAPLTLQGIVDLVSGPFPARADVYAQIVDLATVAVRRGSGAPETRRMIDGLSDAYAHLLDLRHPLEDFAFDVAADANVAAYTARMHDLADEISRPRTTGPLAAQLREWGASDTLVRDKLADRAVSALGVADRWPTFGDDADLDAFQARVEQAADRAGWHITSRDGAHPGIAA